MIGVTPAGGSISSSSASGRGVLQTVEYQEPGDRTRSRYELTQSGRDLVVVLGAIGEWGYRHADRSKGTPYRFVDSNK